MKNIGKSIRIIREIAGIRQGELAKRIDVSSNYISLIENEKRKPSLKFLEKVATELNVPVAAFFWEDIDTNEVHSEDQKKASEKVNSLFWDLIQAMAKSNLKDK